MVMDEFVHAAFVCNLLVMQHHSSIYLMSKENLCNKPFEVVMKLIQFLSVTDWIVRKLNTLEKAQTSFSVVQFGVTSPLFGKQAQADYSCYTERTKINARGKEDTVWSWTSSCTPPSSAKPWDSASHAAPLISMFNLCNKSFESCYMKFDLVPEYFVVGSA